jgi:hypothetical protein
MIRLYLALAMLLVLGACSAAGGGPATCSDTTQSEEQMELCSSK